MADAGVAALLQSLIHAADPRVTTRQLRQEGLISNLPRAQLRARACEFLQRAQNALRRSQRPSIRSRGRSA